MTLAVNAALSLGDGRAGAVSYGSFDPPSGDELVSIDLETGAPTPVTSSTGAFELGGATFDVERGVLLVPNSGRGVVERYRIEGTSTTEMDAVDVPGGDVLPPRHVYIL